MLVSYHRAINDELESITDWYEEQREDLGQEFLFELKKAIDELVVNPRRWAIEYSTTRIGVLDRFPYSVHYRAYTNRVRILGVIHQSRDDTDIRNRK